MKPTRVNPRRTGRFWLHRQHLERFVDLGCAFGLEIGAMDLPFVEPHEGRCEFADFRTTDELSELAKSLPGHNAAFVAPIRYDLRLGYDQIIHKYDYIAASHVIEHVPDVIGWLRALHRLLRPSGVVFLVVPDKRF